MIFHTRLRHSIAELEIELEKFSTGRVPAARCPSQPGTLADDSFYMNKHND